MSDKKNLPAVIAGNLALQRRARELNVRAGEEIFPVLDKASLETFLAERLAGARNSREVLEVAALELPALDEEMVDLVLSENPDTIAFEGQELAVSYRSGYAPSVSIEGSIADDGGYLWNRLPEVGFRLPGGRQLSITVSFGGWNSFSATDTPTLKRQAREHLNAQQWANWTKPEIGLPDLTAEEAVIPEMIMAEYGQCVVEGTSLQAYGVVVVNNSRLYPTDPQFKGQWFRSLEEATAAREKAVEKLESLRSELREQAERKAAQAEAEPVQRRLKELKSAHYYGGGLSLELREQLYNRSYASLPSSAAQIRTWISESLALVAEVEQAVLDHQRKLEEEKQQREEAIQREKEELAVIFEAVPDYPLEQARQAKAFAEDCARLAGSSNRAANILEDELHAGYGFAIQQGAIQRDIHGIGETESGNWFLSRGRARDVDAALRAAIAWLDYATPVIEVEPQAKPQSQRTEAPTEASLEALAAKWGTLIKKKK